MNWSQCASGYAVSSPDGIHKSGEDTAESVTGFVRRIPNRLKAGSKAGRNAGRSYHVFDPAPAGGKTLQIADTGENSCSIFSAKYSPLNVDLSTVIPTDMSGRSATFVD
jgi:hypothetical protein